MSKKLIIAEKPSVTTDIARALGGFTKKGEYLESKEYVLSSAVGHLLELTPPPSMSFFQTQAVPPVEPRPRPPVTLVTGLAPSMPR